jgi:hypothetical protein
MHSDGVLIQHYIGAFHADRAAEFAQHLFFSRASVSAGGQLIRASNSRL